MSNYTSIRKIRKQARLEEDADTRHLGHFLLCFKFINLFGSMVFSGGSVDIESACNARDLGSIPGWGRSPGEGNDNPLQYPCMENSMAREAWQAIVHGVTKSQTRLNITNTQISQYSSDDLCRKSILDGTMELRGVLNICLQSSSIQTSLRSKTEASSLL